ncbi:hypothetical protein CQW49_10705 [Methylosinus trichosporium OB3b]|uniref:Uncharacterized protein n=1 Tax=Methylosinus trichosporium (strain ATCC 35070 / NCIMB 11131 / UNIQEM 75 / OB3b) TaxID=595536 RepID=A0A2D2D026_METT3|nr:hypothetical protein CQW49_10705 [Methylosinus trichosporium OB3b]
MISAHWWSAPCPPAAPVEKKPRSDRAASAVLSRGKGEAINSSPKLRIRVDDAASSPRMSQCLGSAPATSAVMTRL